MMMHPDDEPGFGGYDVYGVMCGTYEEACIAAGVDTPEQIRLEQEAEQEEWFLSTFRQPAFWQGCECFRYGWEVPF